MIFRFNFPRVQLNKTKVTQYYIDNIINIKMEIKRRDTLENLVFH